MSVYTYVRALRNRLLRVSARALAPLAAAIALSACTATELLEVTDPDLINPSDVRSVAGADAVRLGALARFNAATSGSESLIQLGGLLADEWNNGDSFIARQEIDQRVITRKNSFVATADRVWHRARISSQQALDLLRQFAPTAPGWQLAEMYLIQAYLENLAADHFCSGILFCEIVKGADAPSGPCAPIVTT